MRRRSMSVAVALATGISLVAVAPASPAAPLAPAAPAKPDPRQVAAASADRFVAAKPATIRRAPQEKIVRRGVVSGNGLQYVAYERTYGGLPVYGGDFVVVTNATGAVLSTSVAQGKKLSVSTKAKISAARAARTARGQVDSVSTATRPKLTVVAAGTGKLAYETVVSGTRKKHPTKLHVFVDANTGKVTDTWDEVTDVADDQSNYHGTVDLSTAATEMSDPTRSGIRCGGQNGATFTGPDSAWGNGSGTDFETACVDTLYGVQKEWDMLQTWLGRNGINGTGGGFPARVGLNQVNAFWNGTFTNFGHNQANNKQATSTDVVAHEYGHAIFQTTPGGSGGGNGNEKGGLNESAGDIFGALTEHFANEPANLDPPDYLVGEEIDLVGSGEIRNMFNPAAEGDPNCFSASIPNTEVHAAAGPQNHWFYLLAEGSNPGGGKPSSPTCDNSTVTGIGVMKAGQIFMGGLNRKVTAWSHARARIETINAAIQLYPGSSTECNAVKAAWSAVSVPAQAGEAACGAAQNDFSLSLNPTSGSAQAGGSVTTTVNTATTSGSAQQVALSATSSPAGPTVSFSPATVTSGGSSTATVNVPAGTANGNYTITVLGDGTSVDRTATFALTVGTGPQVVFADDFEADRGWTAGTPNTATTGLFQRGVAQATSSGGTNLQLAAAGGTNDLVTGATAGATVGANDIDGGITTIQSPQIALPAGATLTLNYSWYLGHLNNATSADYVRIRIVGTTTTTVLNQTGAASNRSAVWANGTANISSHAGQTVRIVVDAADAGTASLVEAGVDNVRITRS